MQQSNNDRKRVTKTVWNRKEKGHGLTRWGGGSVVINYLNKGETNDTHNHETELPK